MTPDREHPFFRPLWRRVAVVLVCAVWCALELIAGERVWALIAAAALAYGVWQLFIVYTPPKDGPEPE